MGADSAPQERAGIDKKGISQMTISKLLLGAGAGALALACATTALADDQASGAPASTPAAAPAAAAPAPTPPPYPSMGPTLSNNANSASFEAGPLGKITVNGVLTGIAY